MNNTDKEVIGYVLKPECEQYKNAANLILKGKGANQCIEDEALSTYGNHFTADSSFKRWLEEAGVLDLWFNPCYAPEKPKYKIGDWVLTKDNKIRKVIGYDDSDWLKLEGEYLHGNSNIYNHYNPEVGIQRLATEEEIKNASTKVLTLGDKTQKITIKKGQIVSGNIEVTIESLKNLQKKMRAGIDDRIGCWDVTIPSVKIGCCTFTKEEIDTIISTYDKLNK